MNKSGADRWLIGIVIGAILLVVIALVVVLNRADPTYIEDDTPAGVVHNYLLALRQEDYARAHGYLSPTLANYPADAEVLYDHMRAEQNSFRDDGRRAVAVRDTSYFNDERATVRVEETAFYGNGLFGSNQSTSTFDMEVAKTDGVWQLIDGDSYLYWHFCWAQADADCPAALPTGETP